MKEEYEQSTTIQNIVDACAIRNNPYLKEKNKPNSPNLHIRRALQHDVDSIMKLVLGLASYTKELPNAVVHTNPDIYRMDGFETANHPSFYCVVLEAIDDDDSQQHSMNRIVGMGLFYFGYSTWDGRFLYLEDFRNMGGGKCIMYTLADVAQTLACNRFVWQALDWNTNARHFYDTIGAKTLHGSLTMRLEKDTIAEFLDTRSYSMHNSNV